MGFEWLHAIFLKEDENYSLGLKRVYLQDAYKVLQKTAYLIVPHTVRIYLTLVPSPYSII